MRKYLPTIIVILIIAAVIYGIRAYQDNIVRQHDQEIQEQIQRREEAYEKLTSGQGD